MQDEIKELFHQKCVEKTTELMATAVIQAAKMVSAESNKDFPAAQYYKFEAGKNSAAAVLLAIGEKTHINCRLQFPI